MASAKRWPKDRMREAKLPEDGLIAPGFQEPTTVLAAVHLEHAEGTWKIGPQIPIPTDLHGAVVISAVDGNLVGILFVERSQARVALLSQSALK